MTLIIIDDNTVSIDGVHLFRTSQFMKLAAAQRDNNTCQNCGKTTGRMHVHHIVSIENGGKDNLSNLITLCPKCHYAADIVGHAYSRRQKAEIRKALKSGMTIKEYINHALSVARKAVQE